MQFHIFLNSSNGKMHRWKQPKRFSNDLATINEFREGRERQRGNPKVHFGLESNESQYTGYTKREGKIESAISDQFTSFGLQDEQLCCTVKTEGS